MVMLFSIPVDADRPKDNRIVTSEYKDWRKTRNKNHV